MTTNAPVFLTKDALNLARTGIERAYMDFYRDPPPWREDVLRDCVSTGIHLSSGHLVVTDGNLTIEAADNAVITIEASENTVITVQRRDSP